MMNNPIRARFRRALAVCASAVLLAGLPAVHGGPASAEKTIVITFAGDCTLGSEEETRADADSFDSVIAREGYAYPFTQFASLFRSDDWTVVNCEGVLSDSKAGENKGKRYRFRGPSAFAEILALASVESVCLANNHTGDYGAGVEKAYKAFCNAGLTDVMIRLYPGGRHEMLNEINRDTVKQDILNWLNEKIEKL